MIRLRLKGKTSVLTFKGPRRGSPMYKIRREIETKVEDGRRLNFDPPSTVRPDREFLESLEKICGKGCYQLI